jgi:hypothetical protein
MVLHNTDSLVVETATATESLPDPATVPGRTHIVTNTALVAATWSSSGAGGTPFTVDGLNVATLSVPAGRLRQLQSDGTRWIVAPTASRRVFSSSGVSDASGNVTFTFTPAFSVVPNVVQGVQTAVTDVTEARITALTTSSCTVNVRRAPSVVILGISVLQVPQPLVGATVHLHAIEPGQGV